MDVYRVGKAPSAQRSARRLANAADERAEEAERKLAELQLRADKVIARIREYAEGANPPSCECLNILFICQGWQGVRS